MKKIAELLDAIAVRIATHNDHFYGQVVRLSECKTPFVFTTYNDVVEISPVGISREYNHFVFAFNDYDQPYLKRAHVAGDYYRCDINNRSGYVTLQALRNKDIIWV